MLHCCWSSGNKWQSVSVFFAPSIVCCNIFVSFGPVFFASSSFGSCVGYQLYAFRGCCLVRDRICFYMPFSFVMHYSACFISGHLGSGFLSGFAAPRTIFHIPSVFTSSGFRRHVHVGHVCGFSRIPRCIIRWARLGYFPHNRHIVSRNWITVSIRLCALFLSA